MNKQQQTEEWMRCLSFALWLGKHVFSYLTISQCFLLYTVLVYWTRQDVHRKDTEPSARHSYPYRHLIICDYTWLENSMGRPIYLIHSYWSAVKRQYCWSGKSVFTLRVLSSQRMSRVCVTVNPESALDWSVHYRHEAETRTRCSAGALLVMLNHQGWAAFRVEMTMTESS